MNSGGKWCVGLGLGATLIEADDDIGIGAEPKTPLWNLVIELLELAPSYVLAKVNACGRDLGQNILTIIWISFFNPPRKHLRI